MGSSFPLHHQPFFGFFAHCDSPFISLLPDIKQHSNNPHCIRRNNDKPYNPNDFYGRFCFHPSLAFIIY